MGAKWGHSACLRAALALGATQSACSQVLQLKVHDDGTFTVAHNGATWLEGSEVMVGSQSCGAGSLTLSSKSTTTGADPLGDYQAHVLQWVAKDAPNKVLMETALRTYDDDKGVILFEQSFPHEVQLDVSSRRLSSGTLFPAFKRRPGPADDLECFSYHGDFPQMKGTQLLNYKESHQGGTPLAIYNSSDKELPMVVLAPLTFPKAQHMATTEGMFGVGVKASVEVIPAGWRHLVMLSAGVGIRGGMMSWGDRVLRYLGKPRANMYADDVVGTIGFWTDNGGYYHYATGTNETYEEVLPKVKEYHDSLGVPFRHWQFDSWFYPKDGNVDKGGGGGGVSNWTSMPSVFPHGMQYIQSKIKLPIVMHNRQWSPVSDYIHNLSFEWYISKSAAVPKDPVAFFEWFFKQQEGWGLAMYEQDWMNLEYDKVEALQTNITMGDLWLKGIATGAASSNRTVQFCMPYAYDLLSGAAYPALTNARATGDYFHQPYQWAVGGTSLFYWALGILPFKDGFYSSNKPQVGGQTVGPEKDPDREAIMATLSCAMVGPMDGIYLLNASRVMTTCRKDGYVLKPDEPVVTSEACFRRSGDPGMCFVYHAYSDVKGLGRVHYHFSDDGSEPLTPDMVDMKGDVSGHAVYNWYTGDLSMLSKSNSLAAGYEGHIYAIVIPVKDGWVFLGEVDKYVTAAKIRFTRVTTQGDGDSSSLQVQVVGVDGDSVKVCAAHQATWQVICKAAEFPDKGGTQTLTFTPTQLLIA